MIALESGQRPVDFIGVSDAKKSQLAVAGPAERPSPDFPQEKLPVAVIVPIPFMKRMARHAGHSSLCVEGHVRGNFDLGDDADRVAVPEVRMAHGTGGRQLIAKDGATALQGEALMAVETTHPVEGIVDGMPVAGLSKHRQRNPARNTYQPAIR